MKILGIEHQFEMFMISLGKISLHQHSPFQSLLKVCTFLVESLGSGNGEILSRRIIKTSTMAINRLNYIVEYLNLDDMREILTVKLWKIKKFW